MKSRARKFEKGMKLKLDVEGLGSLGEGLAHLEGEEIFIPKVMRGDCIEAEIVESKKGRYRANLIRILSPSPQRIAPHCEHFSICGGCDFQHLPYEEQMAWKLRMTKHWIRRSSLAPHLEKIPFDQISSPHAYGYRHRVRFQVKSGKLHFFKPHSNELFEIKDCPILVDGFFEALKEAAEALPDTRDWSQAWIQESLVTEKASYELEGEKISFDQDCFTQGNLSVNQLIWERIKEDILSLPNRNSALDLFCGVGNFSLPLSLYFKTVTGVESHERSIAWAKQNSSKIEWILEETQRALESFELEHRFFDFVLLDPPRAGAQESVRILSRLMPPRIIYVSCHLESLVKDLVILVKHAGYRIERWTVADMFPQTHHIESIVSLSKH